MDRRVGRYGAIRGALALALPGLMAVLAAAAGPGRAAEVDGDFLNTAKNGGKVVFVDLLDMTAEDEEPRLGGATANLGRHLRNVSAATFAERGVRVVALDKTLEALRRLDFRPEQLDDHNAVRRLLAALDAKALVHGYITPSTDPSLLTVELLLLELADGRPATASQRFTVAIDADVDIARGANLPPLSDNRPNAISPGHPLLDPAAPFTLQLLGPDGPHPLRIRNDRLYVGGKPGEAFRLRLVNRTAGAVVAVVYVDGLPTTEPGVNRRSVDHAARATARNGAILLAPGQEKIIDAWTGRGAGAAREALRFARTGDSTTFSRAFWEESGVVTAVFHPVDAQRSVTVWDVSEQGEWRMKTFPPGLDNRITSSIASASGDTRPVPHAARPAAVLSLHYDSPERVANYRPLAAPTGDQSWRVRR